MTASGYDQRERASHWVSNPDPDRCPASVLEDNGLRTRRGHGVQRHWTPRQCRNSPLEGRYCCHSHRYLEDAGPVKRSARERALIETIGGLLTSARDASSGFFVSARSDFGRAIETRSWDGVVAEHTQELAREALDAAEDGAFGDWFADNVRVLYNQVWADAPASRAARLVHRAKTTALERILRSTQRFVVLTVTIRD